MENGSKLTSRVQEAGRLSAQTYTVVGLGELLWDMMPSGKQLGGAPANFVYMADLLGDHGILASRVGNDKLGEEALAKLRAAGVSTEYVQCDLAHPTGTVLVRLDTNGQPEFSISEAVAWDFIEWTPEWQTLAASADVICFGSLAQRCPCSRQAIRQFLKASRKQALRIFDVNLRQSFYSREVLRECLQLVQVLKLNHEELRTIMSVLGLQASGDQKACARRLLKAYNLDLVCVTRGSGGGLLVQDSEIAEHPGFRVKVADSVGAGDAFTACVAHHYLRGAPLSAILEAANRFAAWVCSQVGAMPSLQGRTLQETLQEITAA